MEVSGHTLPHLEHTFGSAITLRHPLLAAAYIHNVITRYQNYSSLSLSLYLTSEDDNIIYLSIYLSIYLQMLDILIDA